MSAISIKSIKLNTKTIDLNFPEYPTFVVQIGYLSTELSRKMYKESYVTKLDPESGVPFEEVDNNVFAEQFCRHAIKGWSGLTYEILSNLMLIEIPDDVDPSVEIDYSPENALALYLESVALNRWVTMSCKSLTKFRTK